MGVFSNNAITDGGRVLLSYVEMGAIFTPTKIVMGSGTLPAGTTVRTIKDVVAPVKTLTIGKKKRGNDGTVTIGGVYSNQDVTADFYFRELALYARADNQDGSVAAEECLYSYGNAGSTADLMPAYSSGQPVERQIDLVIYVGNDSNVDLTIASGTAMTVEMGEQMVDGLRKEVVQALEGKAEKTHTHTSKDITGLDEAMSGALEGKADKEHTHTKKDITDFPESMPASDVYDWAKQPNKPTYTANEVGAAARSHTHPVSNITGVLPVSKGGTGQTSLTALMTAMGAGKIVAGTYAGNGNESMTINLGFKPKAVLLYVLENKLVLYDYQHPRYSALGIQGNDVINAYYKWYQGTCTQEGPTYKVLSLGDNGFTVYYYSTEGGQYNYGLDCNGNFAGLKLGYVAFG